MVFVIFVSMKIYDCTVYKSILRAIDEQFEEILRKAAYVTRDVLQTVLGAMICFL